MCVGGVGARGSARVYVRTYVHVCVHTSTLFAYTVYITGTHFTHSAVDIFTTPNIHEDSDACIS